MIEAYQKIKYGDLIYIEFYSNCRYSLSSSGFSLKSYSQLDVTKLDIQDGNLFLKDFENNLFVIFPPMPENFINNKTLLDEMIHTLIYKLGFSPDLLNDLSIKKDISTVIATYQDIKKDVYQQNNVIRDTLIGKPIKFAENFILIHMKSQMLVKKKDLENEKRDKSGVMNLVDNYNEDCNFQFYPFNKYDKEESDVYSNQNLHIRKSEKNIWANNPYLYYYLEERHEKLMPPYTKKMMLNFTEDHQVAKNCPFKIKICSNYIDPSSTYLSYSNPFWIVCQSVDKYLMIKPNNQQGLLNLSDSEIIDYPIITYAPVDKNKMTNNIYGLFNIEQIDTSNNNQGNDLRMSPYIQFNKAIRFRHSASKKYLAFIKKSNKNKGNIVGLNKIKVFGTLVLKDKPDKSCEWIFMESYKVLNREKYELAKNEGIGKYRKKYIDSLKSAPKDTKIEPNNETDNNKNNETVAEEIPNKNIVKKKDILRIFHIESNKFLSFEDVIGMSEKDKRENVNEYIKNDNENQFDEEANNHNLTLNKLPLDNDLIRLSPSNESQSWEINLILYFSETLNNLVNKCIKIDLRNLMKNEAYMLGKMEAIPEEKSDSGDEINLLDDSRNEKQGDEKVDNQQGGRKIFNNLQINTSLDQSNVLNDDLKKIISYWNDLKTCFELLTDFCLNKYDKRYDYTISSGKPVYYRQTFLHEQGFLEMTIYFLTEAKLFVLAYSEFIKITEHNTLKMANTLKDKDKKLSKSRVNSSSDNINSTNKRVKTTKQGGLREVREESATISDLFKEINVAFTKSFEFISSMCKSNPENKDYIFKKRNLFKEYLLKFKEAAQCLISIIKDDENYMSELIHEKIGNQMKEADVEIQSNDEENNLIDTLIDHLNDSPIYESHTLSLISKLMKSKNKGITTNQERIYEALFKEKKDNFLLKITPKFNQTIFFVVYKTEKATYDSKNMIELCRSRNTLSDYDKNVVMYLATQLKMYADMCYGRNYVCIEKIREFFPLDHLIFHISNITLHEEILVGLINILNYAYIDIAPHSQILYPPIIKIVKNQLNIERLNKSFIKTFIPLDKLNLILCISLYLLYNIKHEKLLLNTSNINLIFNLISYRLYENVEYIRDLNNEEEFETVIHNSQDNSKQNLKDEVKNSIMEREKFLKEKIQNIEKTNNKNRKESSEDSFFDKVGYKFFEYNEHQEIGPEYIIHVINYINDFFLEKVIIENIDTNMDNKNIIAETFKSISKQDILTLNNVNYLMKINTLIKQILTCEFGNNKDSENTLLVDIGFSNTTSVIKNKLMLPIAKQIYNVIEYVFSIKINDMIDNILENLLKENKEIISIVKKNLKLNSYFENIKSLKSQNKITNTFENKEKRIRLYETCLKEFKDRGKFKKIMMNKKFNLYQFFNSLNYENYETDSFGFEKNSSPENNSSDTDEYNCRIEYLNNSCFKSMQEIIIKMLEVNVNDAMMKILVKIFTRINSQRQEIVSYLKRIRLVYKDIHLKKYSKCTELSKKLCLLTEKTEVWMNEDGIEEDKVVSKDLNNVNAKNAVQILKKIGQPVVVIVDQFKIVNDILLEINRMFFKKESALTLKSIDKRSLIQAMCFSLQIDEILFSLLREICQVYQENLNNNLDADNNRAGLYKIKLDEMIKNIFNLLLNMITKNNNFIETIIPTFFTFKNYNYLCNLGFLKILMEIVTSNPSFAIQYGKNIIDILHGNDMMNIIKSSYFKKLSINNPSKFSEHSLKSEMKRVYKIFKLVNIYLKYVKDDKYTSVILHFYEKVLKHLSKNNSLFDISTKDLLISSSAGGLKKLNTSMKYRIKILTQIIKIGFNLIKVNEKLKELVKKIFPASLIEEKILYLDLDIIALKDVLDICVNKQTTENNEEVKVTQSNCLSQENSFISIINNYYKLKQFSCVLLSITSFDTIKVRDPKNIKSYFEILNCDVNQYKTLRVELLSNDKHALFDILKKSAFKYFIMGIFKILHSLIILIRKDFFSTRSNENDDFYGFVRNLRDINKNFRFVFKEALNEINEDCKEYKSIVNFILKERLNFIDFFGDFKIQTSEDGMNLKYKIDKLFALGQDGNSVFKKNPKHSKKNINQNANRADEIDLTYTMAFTEDFTSNIENYSETKNYIEKEIKILAENLKSKINFQEMTYYYINNNSSMDNYPQLNIHLINIFLKIIQEKYTSHKYSNHIIFLIDLFGHFIEAEPQFFSNEKKQTKSNVNEFEKALEIKKICSSYCQNLFLNNGSVEVFLKIVCEKRINHSLYLSILKFFNMVLEGGNSDAQKKFYELFNSFNNSDNFFLYIKQIFNLDVYVFLKNEINDDDIKTDFFYNDLILKQLKYLQYLTENHYTDLQLFLREQKSNKVSYNFIFIIVDYMHMLLSKMNLLHETNGLDRYTTNFYYYRLISCLETLCEFLQGPCSINQKNIINSKIIEIFDKILRETIDGNDNFVEKSKKKKLIVENNNDLSFSQTLNENFENYYTEKNRDNKKKKQLKLFTTLSNFQKSMLIFKIGLVLLAIIEGRRIKDEIIQKLIRDFDYQFFYEILTELHTKTKLSYNNELEFFQFSEDPDEVDENKIVIEAGFNLYMFLSSLYFFENQNSEFKKLYNFYSKDAHHDIFLLADKDSSSNNQINDLKKRRAMSFYRENCLKIEIVKDDHVNTVYFPKLNFFKNLTDEMIRNFRDNANRTSIQTKLNSLLTVKNDIYVYIKQLHDFENKFKKTGPFKIIFLYPNFFLNIGIFLAWVMNLVILASFNTKVENSEDTLEYQKVKLFELNSQTTHTVLNSIGVILIVVTVVTFLQFILRILPFMYKKNIISYLHDVYEKKTKRMLDIEVRKFTNILEIGKFIEIWNKIQIILKLFLNLEVIYQIGSLVFAILGRTLTNFFFVYHLSAFIKSQPVLRSVLRSVTDPLKQILNIFLLLFLLEYLYALAIYYFRQEIMPDNSCSTIFICLLTIYRETFTSSGNLGNYINSKKANTEGDLGRYFLDISFTLIIVWIVFQMISGIIVDTFSSLRKEQEELENDYKNICFICGLDRETIEKYYVMKDGFEVHLQDHKISNYFCYIFYLTEKDKSEYTGIESYVKTLIDLESIAWIPAERCLKMET